MYVLILSGGMVTESWLDKQVCMYRAHTYAENTKRTYNSHRERYLQFCASMGYSPVPASTEVLCRYAAMLASRLKYSSVTQYMNIIRLLHLEWGLKNPMEDNFWFKCTLKGIRRVKGDCVTRKLPITPEVLCQIYSMLDMRNDIHACLWSAALVMFFALLRRSNVLPTSQKATGKHLKRQDLVFYEWGVVLKVHEAKTIQFQDRALELPLPRHKNSVLCPVQALFHALKQNTNTPMHGSVYTLRNGKVLTTDVFVRHLKFCLDRLGLPAGSYGGHSLRRGGASWAYQSGIPVETIRQLGDWKSLAYLDYIHVDSKALFNAIKQMQVTTNFLE